MLSRVGLFTESWAAPVGERIKGAASSAVKSAEGGRGVGFLTLEEFMGSCSGVDFYKFFNSKKRYYEWWSILGLNSKEVLRFYGLKCYLANFFYITDVKVSFGQLLIHISLLELESAESLKLAVSRYSMGLEGLVDCYISCGSSIPGPQVMKDCLEMIKDKDSFLLKSLEDEKKYFFDSDCVLNSNKELLSSCLSRTLASLKSLQKKKSLLYADSNIGRVYVRLVDKKIIEFNKVSFRGPSSKFFQLSEAKEKAKKAILTLEVKKQRRNAVICELGKAKLDLSSKTERLNRIKRLYERMIKEKSLFKHSNIFKKGK